MRAKQNLRILCKAAKQEKNLHTVMKCKSWNFQPFANVSQGVPQLLWTIANMAFPAAIAAASKLQSAKTTWY